MASSSTQSPSHTQEILERIARARNAQSVWGRYTLTERVRRLRALWSEIGKNREQLAEVIRLETGKPLMEIEAMEIGGVELILKYFTRRAHTVLKDRPASRPWIFFNKRTFVRHVPRGVIGIIGPWNLPLLTPFGDTIPALIAGNAVLLKPSEWTPKTALFLEEIARASGLFPEGLFQVVCGDGTMGASVAAHVDMVMFTGSTRTGRQVAKAAAERLIPAVLELGGKHPMIVLKDAPLKRAAQAAVWGGFANCGQLCVGVERVLVEEALYPAFCEAVIREMKALRQGLDKKYETDLGRMIFPAQMEKALEYLQDAQAKGGRIIGGEVLDAEKSLMAPGLVLDAKLSMKVMQEETFGPVLPIMPVRSVEEALHLANDTPYGLAASIWSRDVERAEGLSAHLEAGLVSINDLMDHYVICALPFGGVKDSGVGRRHSDEGLRMFCQLQSVLVHEWPADVPEIWWFPYSELKSRVVRWLTWLS